MADADTYYGYLEQVLALCQGLLPGTIGGLPDDMQTGITPGLPAIDCCPFLAVYQTTIGEDFTLPGLPLALGHRPVYGRSSLVGITVAVGRCVPTMDENGNFPSIASQQTAAQMIAQDGWVLWNGIYQALKGGTLFNGRCSEYYFGLATSLDPSGGCGGWVIPLRVQIDGYGAI